jgi:CBS domain-containing protein
VGHKYKAPYEDGVLVASIMSSKLTKMNAASSALEVAKKMSENKVSSVILTSNENKIEGIVTERDLVRNVCTNAVLASKTPVISIVTNLSSVIAIHKNSTIEGSCLPGA